MSPSCVTLALGLLFLAGTHAQIKIFNLRATKLPSDLLGTTDGYVKVFCGPDALGKTSVRNNDKNPWWPEEFSSFKTAENDVLRLEVYDSDLLFDDLLGTCQRQVKIGTHQHDCFLKKGGTLTYSYTLQQ
ncbi:perforin-1-like isoform X1 [Hypomesus transpacificus]|uniref:perforin-1-like isoform X1 n=1 Tax=Hypomesus transpacificus TaxID=137520 RepID=UPI001F075F6B|nr:perforin-1-like isoform X1 [Hypomesus transpacificus]